MVKLNFIRVAVTFSSQNSRRAFCTNCCNGIKFKLNAVGGHLSAGLPSRHQVVSSSMLPSRTPFVEENPSTRVLCLTRCFFLFRFLCLPRCCFFSVSVSFSWFIVCFQCCKTKLVVFRGIFSLLPLHHSHPEELPNLILGLRRTTAEMLTGLESSSIVRLLTE